MDGKDIVKSVRKFLHDLYPNVPIDLQREGEVSRPYFHITFIESQDVSSVSAWQEIKFSIQFSYFAGDYWDAHSITDRISQILRKQKVIRGYLYDFTYPAPILTGIAGTLPAGDYWIRISGVNVNNEETLASPSTKINLSSPGGIKISISKDVAASLLFERFRFYFGTIEGGEKFIGETSLPSYGFPEFSITVIPTGTNAPLVSSLAFERFFKVEEVYSDLLEDMDSDGLWTGHIRARLLLKRGVDGTSPIDLMGSVNLKDVMSNQ